VYPKSWAPFHVMQRRTVLLNKNDKPGLKDLEKECLENNAKFENWECDEKKMQLTKNGKALYMHCLPADITGVSCTQGEVSKDVFEKYRLATYAQAGYKPFVIAAIIFLSRIKDPVNKLRSIVENNKERSM
jgi:ornithine carbamoyltransferase